jgi:hypothetical protein
MESTIVDNHAYWRNVWLWTCFSLGTFNTIYYYGESVYMSSKTLCLLPPVFVSYLTWDTYKMLYYKQLYRSDLLAHHIACLCAYAYLVYYNIWYVPSLFMVAENLSLFNYWLDPPLLLKYKLFILLFYRIPFWLILICQPFRNIEYADHFYAVSTSAFFIAYDLFMVKKIIQNPLLFK